MKVWEDFKVVDGVKMWRCDCEICGSEFYHKNPYARACKDKIFHAKLRSEARQCRNGMVPNRTPLDADGSFDNVVKTIEG